MTKVNFYYANGTSYLINLMDIGFSVDLAGRVRTANAYTTRVPSGGAVGSGGGAQSLSPRTLNNDTSTLALGAIYGLNGKTYSSDGNPANDPFPQMLNPDVWNATRIVYPASTAGMGISINVGITKTIDAIKKTTAGTPFALGGYSQGAAVMSGVYNEIKNPTGSLYSRRNDFLGGVMFGNPRRQVNYRGPIGGTWSGCFDDPANPNTNGHGSFPTVGPWARLSNCEYDKWVEFTAPNDIFSSVGDTPLGLNWTAGNDALLSFLGSASAYDFLIQLSGLFVKAILEGIQLVPLAQLFTQPMLDAVGYSFGLGGGVNYFTDAFGKLIQAGGAGHTTYPFIGPPNSDGTYNTTAVVGPDGKSYLKPVGQTCFQLALQWLEDKAKNYATAPIIVPKTSPAVPTFPAWSPRLRKPARGI